MVINGWRFDSRLSEVKSVIDDFCGETVILFVESQCSSSLMYCCKLVAAKRAVVFCEVMVRSSA